MQGVPQHLRAVQVYYYLSAAPAVPRAVPPVQPPATPEDAMQVEEESADPMNVDDLIGVWRY
jgi:hypothetical protein